MPDKGKKSTSAPGSKGRTPSSSHSSISNSGRSMPPTTRSMQGRLSGTSQASSPQAQAGPSQGAVQQGTSQRVMTAAATRGSHAASSDEDDDDDDDDDDEDGDDDDDSEDDSEESDDDGDHSDDDENNIATTVLKIFAMVEPNGLVKSEILDQELVSYMPDNNSSQINRNLLNVVVVEARRNQPFYDALKAVMAVTGDKWSLQMYGQLRTRLEITVARFNRSSSNATNPFDVSNTSKRLEGLIKALESMTNPPRWANMQTVTRLQYFGLILDVLRYVAASDRDHRIRPKSGGSSPYVVDSPINHNLYQRMVCTSLCAHAMVLLERMFSQLGASLGPTPTDQIRDLLDIVKVKDRATPTAHSEDFVRRLRRLRDNIVAATHHT